MKDTGNDVFRRHENCRCRVIYVPTRGKAQDVHEKKELTEEEYKNVFEKAASSERHSLTPQQREFIIDLVNHPEVLGNKSPAEYRTKLEDLGFDVTPLKRGKLKGVEFENGGGFGVNYSGNGYIQYHPSGGSHHESAYYKLSDAKHGKRRFKLNGEELND